jgi:hypothetical protein
MTAWIQTSQLSAEQRVFIQALLADHPWYEFYFKSALSALAVGQDNRFYALGRAGEAPHHGDRVCRHRCVQPRG